MSFVCAAYEELKLPIDAPRTQGLRIRRRRLIVEQAARAASEIQLVIALVLVPAVLLLVVAVLVANADRLIGAAFGQG